MKNVGDRVRYRSVAFRVGVLNDYDAGMSVKEIANKYDMAPQTVWNWCNEKRDRIRQAETQGLTEFKSGCCLDKADTVFCDPEEVARAVVSGERKAYDIARELNVCPHYIYDMLRASGVVHRRGKWMCLEEPVEVVEEATSSHGLRAGVRVRMLDTVQREFDLLGKVAGKALHCGKAVIEVGHEVFERLYTNMTDEDFENLRKSLITSFGVELV